MQNSQRGYADIVVAVIALFCVVIVALAWFARLAVKADNEKWVAFAKEHQCKKVEQIPGEVFNTIVIGPNGQPVVWIASTPSRTGYLCDDGVTYYR